MTADVPGVSDGQRAFLRRAIRTALAAEGVDFPCEVDVRLTNDETIRQINLDMREVDRPTDVLSFPAFDLTPGELPGPEDADPGTGLVPLGDMVISMERVAAQAKEYGHSNRRELAYLTVHSVLHLLGYDHLDEGPRRPRCAPGRRPSWRSWDWSAEGIRKWRMRSFFSGAGVLPPGYQARILTEADIPAALALCEGNHSSMSTARRVPRQRTSWPTCPRCRRADHGGQALFGPLAG